MSVSKRKLIASRKSARFFLIQALYEWQIAQSSLNEISANLAADNEKFAQANSEYFHELLQNIVQKRSELDSTIAPFLDRDVSQVDPIEHAILWLGTYELQYQLDIPYKSVINEAVELAKQFGAEGSHRYVNGILDKIAKTVPLRNGEK
ncbi:transcription antitermination factor NusB [Ignatzschineria cameli]|uniref:Transcription antitermination protein NusB n=1 Tax=Ignatzschineria cameli TaxID=2182793 RepID=A0A2U2AL26_9GAMM|nr:transcription antitermination factor NusB [Ignatzschineria cameli]PWD83923.1 transcription antitermination factor NusB [Ignatzschineria cameli]PWD85429.1 transcription antitermination factor NusB [Ignatzschineria cameli]PWD88858.1 transcription antitermination factor NusB [Ignatzschineria cameli]PWD90248.1 transcription antitermination factor NusB [Ignatzschineria cameli]PWD90719.1 transcription antitermination factor NusB [Ignatzschineria cameli]